jgi:hypothetical protein
MSAKEAANIRTNIFTAIGIIIVCAWVVIGSVEMSKRALDQGVAKIYTVPGLLPFIIAIITMGMSIYVVLAYLPKIKSTRIDFKKALESMYAPLLVFGLLFFYVFILIPHTPFVLGTIIFTSLFMAAVNATSVFKIAIISVVYSVLIVLFFTTVVGVQFPVSILNF